MKWVLFLWAFLMFALAMFTLVNSKSAIHEIEAGIAGLIATVAMSGAVIVEAIQLRSDR